MRKIDVNYSQFAKALRLLGFSDKVIAPQGVVFRHADTDFRVVLPPGAEEDLVPPMYQEIAQRTIALRGIASNSQFERAVLATTGNLPRVRRNRVSRPHAPLTTIS